MINNPSLKILVLGANGLLGNTVFRTLFQNPSWNVRGTLRNASLLARFPSTLAANIIAPIDVTSRNRLQDLVDHFRPAVVVNCVGVTKHVPMGNDPIAAYKINSLLPHCLAALCANAQARLIHISTDCVFSGTKGMYIEEDQTDADDIYGQSKASGEVTYTNSITLRTSIIGHELSTTRSLLAWFLKQKSICKGFRKAYFSGVPTVTLAGIIRDVVIPNPMLNGLFHVASKRISKFDLLTMIAKIYQKEIQIIPEDSVIVDRSLDATRFQKVTGYEPPDWSTLVNEMHSDFVQARGFYEPTAL